VEAVAFVRDLDALLLRCALIFCFNSNPAWSAPSAILMTVLYKERPHTKKQRKHEGVAVSFVQPSRLSCEAFSLLEKKAFSSHNPAHKPRVIMPVEAATAPATAKAPKFIKFDISSFAARITLNHPPYNVLNVPLMTEMAEAIESLNGRPEIKCIVLDAVQDPKVAQKMFSAGISLETRSSDRVFQTLDISTVFPGYPRSPAIDRGGEWAGGWRRIGTVAFGDL